MMVSAKAFPGLIVRWIAAALLAAVWLFPAQARQEKIDQAETGAVIALSEDVTALDGCVPYIQEGAVLTLRDSGEVLPAVVILFALLLVVWPDNYLSRERKRSMILIIALVFGLIFQNWLDNRLSLMKGTNALRLPLSVFGYAARPAILAMFLSIVKPGGREETA